MRLPVWRRATLSAWPCGRPGRPFLHAKVRIARGLALALAASLLSACRQAPPAAAASIPAGALRGFNVLLVTIDTLRADHVGAYGSVLGATPTLDRFAAEGLRFDVAHAHVPMTLPSHTTIMTGRYPV